MQQLLEQLKKHRLVPAVVIDAVSDALPLADALRAGGLPIIEVTFRTPAAEQALRDIARAANMLVGAGTVLNVQMAQRAIDAGASFIVTPGVGPKVIEFCLSRRCLIIPGVSTASDLQAAVGEYSLPLVKFFPAEASGGLKMLDALAGPFPSLKFMPTGGITPDNLKAYLNFPPVLACGGSWMAPRQTISARQFDKIRQLTAAAVELVKTLTQHRAGSQT